jgi:hypothetical protein
MAEIVLCKRLERRPTYHGKLVITILEWLRSTDEVWLRIGSVLNGGPDSQSSQMVRHPKWKFCLRTQETAKASSQVFTILEWL